MEKTKVLFVDDDIALGQVVILALRASGYAAEYCTTLVGIQGVVQEMQPDIMVLDVEIGEKNGIDAVAELKLTAPDTPVLFVSSHIAGSEVARALDAGGIAYLRKPFEMEELVAYIRRHTPCFHPKGLSIGMFNLRAGDSMLFKGEEPVRRLTDFEYKLLKLLAQNMGIKGFGLCCGVLHYAGRDSGCGSGNAAGHNGAGCRDRREEWNRCRCGTQADGSRYTGFICLFTHSRFGSGKGAGCRWHRLSAKAFRNGGVGGLHTQAHAMFSSERTIHRNVQSESRRQYVVQRRGTCEKAD